MSYSLVEAANMGIEPAYKAFCVEELPHMLKAMESAKADYESLEGEDEMLENQDESNTTQKVNAECARLEASRPIHLCFSRSNFKNRALRDRFMSVRKIEYLCQLPPILSRSDAFEILLLSLMHYK